MKAKSLLIIGDERESKKRPARPFVSFVKHVRKLIPKNAESATVSYKEVLVGKLPVFKHPMVEIILFFPYDYWNEHIEVYDKDKRLYGDDSFGKEYARFFKMVENRIKKAYSDKKIIYLNHPSSSLIERDKKKAKHILNKNGIPSPKVFRVTDTKKIYRILEKGKAVYIKPRFGALGKGITYLSRDSFITNFKYKHGKIINRRSDYGWRCYRLKKGKRNKLLQELIRRKFIFEEAIEHPVHRGKRFDFRVHVIYGKTPYFYAKAVPAKHPITNWTQGGRIVKKERFLRYVPRDRIESVRQLAVRVAKALNLGYAGIDIVLSKDLKNVYCLEAHSFPGYEKGFDIMKYIAKSILKGKKESSKK